MTALARLYHDRRNGVPLEPMQQQRTEALLGLSGGKVSEDVYDLPEGDREHFSDDVQRDTFQQCGVDDYAPVDTTIARNGHSYFATRL